MADDGPPTKAYGRAPAGVAALLAGAAAAVPVFAFDAVEVAAGRWFGEGASAFVGVVLVFALAWLLVALPVLAFLAPRPAREGLGAGALVAAAMLWFLVGDSPPRAEVPIRLFIWIPLACLAVGFGACTGLLAQRLRRSPSSGSAPSSSPGSPAGGAPPDGRAPPSTGRGAALAAVAAMAVLAATSTLFLGPPGGPLTWAVLAIVVVVGGGALALLAGKRRGPSA